MNKERSKHPSANFLSDTVGSVASSRFNNARKQKKTPKKKQPKDYYVDEYGDKRCGMCLCCISNWMCYVYLNKN